MSTRCDTLIPLKRTRESRSWFDDIPRWLSAPWLSLPRVSSIVCVRGTITSRDSAVSRRWGQKGKSSFPSGSLNPPDTPILANTPAVQRPRNVLSRKSIIDHPDRTPKSEFGCNFFYLNSFKIMVIMLVYKLRYFSHIFLYA